DCRALRGHPARPVQGRPRRGGAGPGGRRRRVRRARDPRQARRELHAARGGRGAQARRRDQEMIPELGQIALLLALAVGLILAALPLVGAARGKVEWMSLARPAALAHFVLVLGAFAALSACFVRDDFSVLYVASNSNSTLPLAYRLAGVWGGHE